MSVLDEIAAERRRQIEVEGFTPDHDAYHANGEIARAAACYAWLAGIPWDRSVRIADVLCAREGTPQWPWEPSWWKPKDRRRDLIRAAALIVAEIERLDRAAQKDQPQ